MPKGVIRTRRIPCPHEGKGTVSLVSGRFRAITALTSDNIPFMREMAERHRQAGGYVVVEEDFINQVVKPHTPTRMIPSLLVEIYKKGMGD